MMATAVNTQPTVRNDDKKIRFGPRFPQQGAA